MRAIVSLWRHIRGRKDDTTGDSSGPHTLGTHGTTASVGKITVHIELNEVRQLDDGTTTDVHLHSPSAFKSMPSEFDSRDNIHSSSIKYEQEEGDISVEALEDSRTARLQQMHRAQVSRAMEFRQEAMERKQDRREFKKQI